MEPSVFVAHSVADVLSAVPTFFGFVPEDSVIVVTTRGRRARFDFRMRLDLPPVEHVDDAADFIEAHARRQEPDGVVLVVISPRQDVAALMLDALLDRFNDLDIVVCVRADGERYWVPGEDESIPYDSQLHHPAVVAAIAAGQEILHSREELAARFEPVDDADVVGEMDCALHEALPILAANGHSAALAEAGSAVVMPALDRALASALPAEPRDIALLAVWSSTVAVRDEMWQHIDRETAEEMLRVWADVARRAPEGFATAALCLAAFSAWLGGDGVQASIATERALRIDPEYSCAGLMQEMLMRGVDPRTWQGWGAWPHEIL